MDENQQNSNMGQVPAEDKKSFGPLVGIIIIIIILAVGAFYFLSKNKDAGLPEVSSSDEVSSIEEELNAEPVDGSLEDELNTIEAELDAEIKAQESAQ